MQTIYQNALSDTMYYRNFPVLSYLIEYPSFTTACSVSAAEQINEVYAYAAASAENHCRTVLYVQAAGQVKYIPPNGPGPVREYEWTSRYYVTYNQGCFTSLYTDQYCYMGGAHGNTIRTSDTWDFETGRRVTLSDIFSSDYLSPLIRNDLFEKIEKQIQERLEKEPGSYFKDYPSLLREHFRPESFYLTPDGLTLYYQQYDVAPYATGFPEFFFPRSELAEIAPLTDCWS